ncbi:TPA: hypothetical protein SOL97_003282 [Clostridioides difficile]|nr:hypothetical protein [Clostridioides difficile]
MRLTKKKIIVFSGISLLIISIGVIFKPKYSEKIFEKEKNISENKDTKDKDGDKDIYINKIDISNGKLTELSKSVKKDKNNESSNKDNITNENIGQKNNTEKNDTKPKEQVQSETKPIKSPSGVIPKPSKLVNPEVKPNNSDSDDKSNESDDLINIPGFGPQKPSGGEGEQGDSNGNINESSGEM